MNDTKTMLRFRESFRGYNKDDVNAYIEQINIRFSRKESELRAQIAELQTLVHQAKASVPSSDSSEKEKELNERLSKLSSENEALMAEVSKLSSTLSSSESEEKSKLYDSMSSQVGNILIVANSNADKIISDAEEKACRIKEEAEIEAAKIKKNADEKMSLMLAKLDEKLKSVSDTYLDDYTKLVNDSKKRLSEITEAMMLRSEQLLFKADNAGKSLGKEISEGYYSVENNSQKE